MSSKGEEPLTKPEKELSEKLLNRQRTTYFETLAHLFKGNIGPACFAMAEAIKHSGIILGPILTVFLSVVCVFQQHVLIKFADRIKTENSLESRPDYAETLELCMLSNEKWRKYSKIMKRVCNVFICVTQFGFCSVYFLFIGNNVKHVLDFYGFEFNFSVLMMFSLVPIIPTSLITNLRYLGELILCLHQLIKVLLWFFYHFSPVFWRSKLLYVLRNHRHILLLITRLTQHFGPQTCNCFTSWTSTFLWNRNLPLWRHRAGVAVKKLYETSWKFFKDFWSLECRNGFSYYSVHFLWIYWILEIWRKCGGNFDVESSSKRMVKLQKMSSCYQRLR